MATESVAFLPLPDDITVRRLLITHQKSHSGVSPANHRWSQRYFCETRLVWSHAECRVDLVAECNAAGVDVSLAGVEAVHHVRITNPMFEVDKPE